MNKPILLDALKNALQRLIDGYTRYQENTGDIQIRDGLIQRYEFTYEVSHKILKRYLETTSASLEIYDSMPFSDLIRSGNEQSLLLGNWNKWQVYREMRIKSSRADDEELALEVVSIIPEFILEAKELLKQLELRNA